MLTRIPEAADTLTPSREDGATLAVSGVLSILTSVFGKSLNDASAIKSWIITIIAELSALAIRHGVHGDLSLNVCHGDKKENVELP